MKKLYFLLTMLLIVSAVWSQNTYTWNGSNNASWAQANNWSPNRTSPSPTDTLLFSAGNNRTITNVPTETVGRIRVFNNTTIVLSGAANATTLTVGNNTGDDFIVTSGSTLTQNSNLETITLAASATANIGGTFITAGTFSTGASSGISVLSGGILRVNSILDLAGTSSTATIDGTLENAGTISNATATKLVIPSGGTYAHAQTGGAIPTAGWSVGSTCSITAANGTAPTGLGQAFSNFTWNAPGQSADINLNGALTTVNGNLTVSNTNNNDLVLTGTTALTLAVGGNVTIGSAVDVARVILTNNSASPVVNITGNLSLQNSGELILTNTGNAVNTDLNVTGDLSIANTASLTFTTNDGNANLDLTGNYSQSGGSIDFSSGGTVATGTSNATMTIAGNFSLTSGTITTSSSDVDVVNGRITFVKNGTQTFSTSNVANITRTNFIVAANSILQLNSNLGLSRNATANFKGTMTVNSGGALNASTFTVAAQGGTSTAIFNLNAGGKLITANNSGVPSSINTTNLTTTLSSAADYEFRGTSTGVFTTSPTALTARDIIVNNTTGNVTLSQAMTVNGTLQLTAGLLTTTTNLLTISATGSASAATAGSYVNGPLAKTGTSDFTFPVGKSGAGYRNISTVGMINATAATTFRAEFFRAAAPAGTPSGGIARVSSCEYWDLARTTGPGDARVKLSWESTSPCNGGYVNDLSTLVVAHLTGGNWVNEGQNVTSGNNTAGDITSGNVLTTFSPFALGATNPASNPLPVMFDNVRAYEKNNGVQIEWTNLTERELTGYRIEYSTDGRDFTVIGTQVPVSNQNDRADYTAFHATPSAGANFYRIKALQIDGKIIYSKILRIEKGQNGKAISLYPNPVKGGQITVSLTGVQEGRYTVRVISSTGQAVYQKTITAQSTGLTQTFDLSSAVKPGVYTMIVAGDNYSQTKLFVVQ